jgi:murein DD-endopeptidase MepM/ murein hydrolase activator NlpD
MNKLFYFSKTSLQYVEMKNFKSKLMLYSGFVIFLIILCTISGYLIFTSAFNSGNSYSRLRSENVLLKGKLDEIGAQYTRLNNELDSLVKANGDLRIATNLPPISGEEMKVGVGGGYFDNNVDFSSGHIDSRLQKTLTLVDGISRKFEFEKSNYLEISSKIKENRQLFEAIPAIKPCYGTLDINSFGMRMHPILKIMKMHEGVDIVTDIGTSVYATGKGVVEFAGIKSGFGLCVEINHGFGYTTMYGHLSSIEVNIGQKVDRGTEIAKSGNSGLSSGPHLHYEVSHNGVKLNPVDFFFDDMSFFAAGNKN